MAQFSASKWPHAVHRDDLEKVWQNN